MENPETQNSVPKHKSPWLLAALLVVPGLIILAKLPGVPGSLWMSQLFSVSEIPQHMQRHAEYILFVPLSAIVVCFFRLTLGLPVLSLFRPILTAIAFRIIGIPLGLAFLLVVLTVVVLIKPLIKDAHYYVRVPLLLSLVAAFLVVPLRFWHVELLRRFAYFPIISLSLLCEGFTKILNDKGLRAAMWPTINTINAAIVITLLARIPGALHMLLRYPEVLFMQGGIILLIGKYLDLELFAGNNPFSTAAPVIAAQDQPAQLSMEGLK
jgi:hypothetical protein